MVHIAIENLLSTCNNRPLYEALWFLAYAKNNRPEVLENESISGICNELISRINNEEIDARSFLVSTNLVFGTIRLYKVQIDKLYDQTKLAVQSFKTIFYQIDWVNEMTQSSVITSTPIVPSKKKPQTQKSNNKKGTKKQPEVIMDDFDIIENMYKLLDTINEDEETLVPEPKNQSKRNSQYDTGIDPTMASNVLAITLKEPTSLLTSGFNTMLNNEDEEGFGDINGEGFESLLKETADAVFFQNEIIGSTSGAKTRKRTSNMTNNSEVKKRRLTYMSYNDTFGTPRNANADQQMQNIDIYQQSMREASTFNENISVSEELSRNHDVSSSTTNFHSIEPMEIENDSYITFNEPTTLQNVSEMINSTSDDQTTIQNASDMIDSIHNDHTTIQNDCEMKDLSQNESTLVKNSSIVPVEMNFEPQDSEMILEKVTKDSLKKHTRKSRVLIVDKQTIMPAENVKKINQSYTEKMVGTPPFKDFNMRMHYFKSCSDLLFSTGSFRLTNSKLNYLYTRNMKKIPEITLKKQKMNVSNEKKINASTGVQKKMKTVNNEPIMENEDADVENIPPNGQVLRHSTRSRKLLKESNVIEQINEELEIFQPLTPVKNKQSIEEVELPPAIEHEVIEQASKVDYVQNDSEKDDRKKLILKILKKFWDKKDNSITMNKLCIGMSRSDAAGAFFEILLLAKYCVVELVQDSDSLEITNILCKIPKSQLSIELIN